jgi:GT2 family glycosyltransferase
VPDVTAVVVAWNSAATLSACLTGLQTQTSALDIIVVDNGSTDDSAAIARATEGVTLVSLPRNTGFTGGHIAGFARTSAPFILLVNADAVLDVDWLENAMAVMRAESDVAVVGGQAQDWDGGGSAVGYLSVHPFTGRTRLSEPAGTASRDVAAVSGAAMLVRRSAIEQVGYLHPSFFAYWEEVDLCARFIRANWRVRYESRCLIRHVGAAGLGPRSTRLLFLMARNHFLFGLRNFDRRYLRTFLIRWAGTELRNAIALLRRPTRLRLARLGAALSAIARVPAVVRQRREIVRQGSYNARVIELQAPRVGVVIPNHNHGAHVVNAVESALTQTFGEIHVVVVDDGSDDDSRAILERYADHPQVDVRLTTRGGVARARNAGAAVAPGDWLVFLDADDTLRDVFVERTWRALLKARGEVAVAYSDVRHVGALTDVRKAGRFCSARLAAGNFISVTALVSRAAFEEVGGFTVDLDGYEDWDLWLAVTGRGWGAAYAAQPLLNYRRAGGESRNSLALSQDRELRSALRRRHNGMYDRGLRRSTVHRGTHAVVARVRFGMTSLRQR